MSYKLLVLDLDDTLLNEDLEISKDNLVAIKEIRSKGVHVILCSGRPLDSMMPYAHQLDVHDDQDYIVSFNGAIINRFDGSPVKYTTIKGNELVDLVMEGRQRYIDVQLYTEGLTVERYTERTKHYEGLTGVPANVVNDLTQVDESIKVLFNHTNKEELEELRKELVSRYKEQYNIFYSKPFYLEVLDKTASKGLAIKYLSERLGVKREEIIAVGDSYNDVSMIEYAGLGIAMQNAPGPIKEIADYITERTNNESIVVEIKDKFFS